MTDRTLRRDVERLRELGYPVQGRAGVDGGYRVAAGASLPPLVLEAPAPVVRRRVVSGAGWTRPSRTLPGADGDRRPRLAAPVLGAVRAEFTVIPPDELRERLGEWSQRLARAALLASAVPFRPAPQLTTDDWRRP
jgi:hypothetical protein